jgi:hypothetical protein
MGANQRFVPSRKFGPATKLASTAMDNGAPGSYSGKGNKSSQAVTDIPNPAKAVAKSYSYKDGVGNDKKVSYSFPKGGKTGEQ